MLLFGDPTFREFGDLDILVPISDVVRARDVLLANGYVTKYLTDQFESYTQFGHELDLEKIIGIAKASNYRGYLPIETLSQGDPFSIVPPFLKKVRMALATVMKDI